VAPAGGVTDALDAAFGFAFFPVVRSSGDVAGVAARLAAGLAARDRRGAVAFFRAEPATISRTVAAFEVAPGFAAVFGAGLTAFGAVLACPERGDGWPPAGLAAAFAGRFAARAGFDARRAAGSTVFAGPWLRPRRPRFSSCDSLGSDMRRV
jgi:hypothetical protein